MSKNDLDNPPLNLSHVEQRVDALLDGRVTRPPETERAPKVLPVDLGLNEIRCFS